jgi:uncharacterized ferredoxin-like protein
VQAGIGAKLIHEEKMSELDIIANLMAVAARTAPKAAGKDYVVTRIVKGSEVQALAEEMAKFGQRTGKKNFDRDGRNVAASDCVVLIGIKDAQSTGLNCSACGAELCTDLAINSAEGEFRGPQCAMRVLDMGIALGSAVKVAGLLNVDNRIMYRAGVVAREMGLVDADLVMGIPLSATGKSIYFDR